MSGIGEGEGEWLTESQAVPLLWRPWYLGELDRPDGAVWVWSIVQNACGIPDPAAFRPIEVAWPPAAAETLARYVTVAERLVATTVMNAGASIHVNLVSGEVTKVAPADDATIGFAGLLRQLFKPSEEASFDRVRKLAAQAAHDAGLARASAALGVWKRAHQTLLRRHLRSLIHQLATDVGYEPAEGEDGERRMGTTEEITPAELIQAFLYGDMLHWGDGRERLQAWSTTPRGAAQMEFEMRNDAHVLAHLYAGFADIVRRLAA